MAVEGRRHHHRVGEGRGSGAGSAGRGYQGAEMEQGTQGEEGGARRERLQVAGRCVSRQRPISAAVPPTTAGAANTHGGVVT